MATTHEWIEGARPRTLPAAIAPVAVGAGLGAWADAFDGGRVLLALESDLHPPGVPVEVGALASQVWESVAGLKVVADRDGAAHAVASRQKLGSW